MSVAGAAALRESDYELLGSLMNVCHGFLNAIEVSTPELERSMVAVSRRECGRDRREVNRRRWRRVDCRVVSG